MHITPDSPITHTERQTTVRPQGKPKRREATGAEMPVKTTKQKNILAQIVKENCTKLPQ